MPLLNTPLLSELRRLAMRLDDMFPVDAASTSVEATGPTTYSDILDFTLFHADLRYRDFVLFTHEDGDFATRLHRWLANVETYPEKRILFKILSRLIFIDRPQTASLCRDAYRRIITPWLTQPEARPPDPAAPDFDRHMRRLFTDYALCSITESFPYADFRAWNSLQALRRPWVLTDKPDVVRAVVSSQPQTTKGLVILEDFVGTGHQARSTLDLVLQIAPPSWRVLFVPLILLEAGLTNLAALPNERISAEPVTLIPNSSCISPNPRPQEAPDLPDIRRFIEQNADRVCERFGDDDDDDPPKSPYGYQNCGAVLVTYYNAPNNTLPLIHHRAANWRPLFRRAHHRR